MENDDFEYDLAVIAEHAHRTGRLESAASVRARSDRRRRRRYGAMSVLGVAVAVTLGAGVAAAPPDRGGVTPALSTTSASTPPSVVPSLTAPTVVPGTPSAPASASPSRTKARTTSPKARPKVSEDNPGPLSGERQLFIFTLFKGEEVPESVVAVTKEQDVEVTLDYGERALFVPVRAAPEGDEYVMKTAKIRSGDEALCWSVQDAGGIVVDACDFGDPGQKITIEEAGRDNQDRMTYTLRNRDRYLIYDPQGEGGFAAKDVGGKDPESTYVFIDRGESTIPTLG